MKELSKKSTYWLPKERLLELKHFVNQWNDLIVARNEIFLSGNKTDPTYCTRNEVKYGLKRNDPTAIRAMKLFYYDKKLDILVKAKKKLETVVHESDDAFLFIMYAIQNNLSYDVTATRPLFDGVAPLSRRKFYEYLRYFYWVLDQIEKEDVLN